MKKPFSLNQARFYYPGQEIMVKTPSRYNVSKDELKELEKGQWRLIWVAMFFAFAFFAISIQLFKFTILNGDEVQVARNSSFPLSDVSAKRADIVDRNGIILATNLPTSTLCSDNTKVRDKDKIARALVRTLPDLKYEKVMRTLNKKSRCAYIERGLIPAQKSEVNRLGFPALIFQDEEKRVYPQGNLFAHIVGAVDTDNNGVSGIEKTFNTELTTGKEPLRLSVDAGVQDSVRNILGDAIKKFSAKGGVAIVMEAGTSEIIAMTSLPDFDPNNIDEASAEERFNQATLGVYEMGSVFKIFNTAMALENNVIKMNDKIDSSPLKLASFSIRDMHPLNRPLSPTEVMVHSSNTASARIALDAGEEKQQAFLQKLGLLRPLTVELPEKSFPILPQKWRRESTIATVSYGYGIAVTPLHLINAVGAVANGGTYRPATLLFHRPELLPDGTRVMKEKTSKTMRKMLRAVVTEGTGKSADVLGYEVGGKTGSAEKTGKGKYEKDSMLTSFVAVFPTRNPRYLLFVMLDSPKKTKETFGLNTAGWNVAPTAKKIIETIAPQLEVLPDFETI